MDTCQEAYAPCISCRPKIPSCVNIQLIRAKPRVVPIKQTSVPTLELTSCNIGVRIAYSVQALCSQNMKTFFFSGVILWSRCNY